MRRYRALAALGLLLMAPAAWADFESGLRAADRGDQRLAFWEWLFLALRDDRAAQFNVGAAYYNGDGVERDYGRAAEWYRRAAAQGHPRAEFLLGMMHEAGRGVPRDEQAAVEWFRLAARQGYPAAQHSLGVVYRAGRGVPRDVVEAGRWFLRAAEQGHVPSQIRAGVMYEEGEGVAADLVQAYKWYRLASARLDTADRREIERLVQSLRGRMSPAELATAERLAREWRPRAEAVDRAAPVWPRAAR